MFDVFFVLYNLLVCLMSGFTMAILLILLICIGVTSSAMMESIKA